MKRPTTVTVSSKGRVTIPKKLRDRLSIAPGASLELFVDGDRLVARRVTRQDRVEQVYGVLTLHAPADAIVQELRADDSGA